ncbi:hypothetical protein KCV03_g10269, partial [Aureobasidium melanogenum]
METVDMDSVPASDTSPFITDNGVGVRLTPSGRERTGSEPELREHDRSASRYRDSWDSRKGEKGMLDAVVAEVTRLRRELLSIAEEARDRQEGLLAKIAEASRLPNPRHGPTIEEMCSSLFAEHSARTIETKQEDVFSRFYNHLSSQQAEVGRKLESTIFRIRQEISDRSLSDQKEIVEAIESRTQRDLQISHDATIKRLNRVEEQLRDRFARAGLGIVDELKSVQTMGMEVTNKLSRKWRENSAEMAQSQMRNVDKSDILGGFSNMQKHAMRLEQEVRDLRKAFKSWKDGSPETQSKSIASNMPDEAESTIQADIREGISQMQQMLIEHTQMQRRMDEKTQAFQDQQVITLAGVKFQVDAIVSELPNSKEAVTSLKQAAQYFCEASEKLERLKGDPEITDMPLDLKDNRADFVESDRACGVLERLQRAVDVPEALDRTEYFTSTPAHESQLRDFASVPLGLLVSPTDTMIVDKDPTSNSTTDGQDGVGTSNHTKLRYSTLQDSIAEPERQIESSENHLVQSDTASPATHCGQTATSLPTQRPASHPQVSTHRQNIAQSPSKTYQGFQMSATDVPTNERGPEQPSSLPPERRCGEKRPREEDTAGHQGIKMKAPRLTVPLDRIGNDHNPDLFYGEDERIASVADIQMADSPTSDDQPSSPREDHASEPNYDTDNAANLNESDVESVKSVWRSRVQEHKAAKQMNRYIIDNARKEVRSELRHPETRFNGRYEDGSTFTLGDGAPQYPSREEISASAFLPTLTAQESASLEVAKRPSTMEQLHDQENPRQLSMSPRTTSREGHKAGNHIDSDSRDLEPVSRGQVTPEKLNEETGTRPMHPSHMINIISRASMYGRSAQPIESVGQDSMIMPTGGDSEEVDIVVPLHLIERSQSPVSQVGHNLQVYNFTQPQHSLVNSQHDGRTLSGMDGDRLSRGTEDNGLKQGVRSLVDSDDVELIKETRLPDARSVGDEHILVAPARDGGLSGTTCSPAPSSSQRIVGPGSILPDASIKSSTVLADGQICAADDHQQQALDVEPSSTRQNNFSTDPIESGEQSEQGTMPDSESHVEFASINPFCQTGSEVEL